MIGRGFVGHVVGQLGVFVICHAPAICYWLSAIGYAFRPYALRPALRWLARALTALNPETKRARVFKIASRGSMTSMSINFPRRKTARSMASFSSLRVLTRSP